MLEGKKKKKKSQVKWETRLFEIDEICFKQPV